MIRILFQYLRNVDEGSFGVARVPFLSRLTAFVGALLLVFAAAPAAAAVELTFWSKEAGSSFPHAFVTVHGTPDRGGARIDEDYGFSAKKISPAILMGRVKGVVLTDNTDSYIRASDRHFTVKLTDAQFDALMATIARWQGLTQPSYDLARRNCVHFVGELAASIGMSAAPIKGLMKKPRAFLEAVTQANRAWLASRGATVHALR
jgi:hypothetical protein